jgi:hypothetical protein
MQIDSHAGIDHQEEPFLREVSAQSTSPKRAGLAMSLPTGLSALIQAATSQLGIPADEPKTAVTHSSNRVFAIPKSDDTSEEGVDGLRNKPSQSRTPVMIPEPDPRKQSFPELLMTLAMDPLNIDTIAFLPDGKFFAIRSQTFSQELMTEHFVIETFAAFLEVLEDWGFTRVKKDEQCLGIEVFHHPLFLKGDWIRCSQIEYGKSPTEVRISALPERARLEFSYSPPDDSEKSIGVHSKRRLSPDCALNREADTSLSWQKKRADNVTSYLQNNSSRRSSMTSVASDLHPDASFTGVNRTDDLRSIALSITADKLRIRCGDLQSKTSQPLIDCAVQSATHNIVTDAIETLLRDETHTQETYRRHERELSKSSLPGLVPISKQLFSHVSEDLGNHSTDVKPSEGEDERQSD